MSNEYNDWKEWANIDKSEAEEDFNEVFGSQQQETEDDDEPSEEDRKAAEEAFDELFEK